MYKRQEIANFTKFGELLFKTEDLDPVYPLLSWWCDEHEVDKMWAILVQFAVYNIAESITILEKFPRPERVVWDKPIKVGTERRYHRGNQGQDSLKVLDKFLEVSDGDPYWFLGDLVHKDPLSVDVFREYREVEQRFLRVKGIGNWAVYKLCDFVQQVVRAPIVALDVGRLGTAKAGIMHTVNVGLEEYFDKILPIIFERQQIYWKEYFPMYQVGTYDMSVLETVACKYHSLRKGYYYVGKDFDDIYEGAIHKRNEWLLERLESLSPLLLENVEHRIKDKKHFLRMGRDCQIYDPLLF